MNNWGCFGLSIGALAGLLLVGALWLVLRPAPPPVAGQPATLNPDATIFVSERILSQLASRELGQPVLVDFDENGDMRVTARTPIAQFEPALTVGLSLQLDGAEVVSRLRWVELGFLTIPATWLPIEAQATAAQVGQTITAQTPPDFVIVGLTSAPEGVTVQLKWAGG